MNAGALLQDSRRRAGVSQRALAVAARIPQSTVARIERGRISPTVDTLDRLLRAAGRELATERRLGQGIDRTAIRERLAMSPAERMRVGVQEARALAHFELRPKATSS